MNNCVKEIEDNAFSDEQSAEEKLIATIPGFATRLSAIVASEVGDFDRFPSSNQFKAYVGIDPKVIQSGSSLKTGKITKRGNPYLRCAFYLAAQVARIHDPELKEFFIKKINEGKPFRVAVCAVARKLCERVYAVVTKGIPYQKKQLSFS
jgi:transposase